MPSKLAFLVGSILVLAGCSRPAPPAAAPRAEPVVLQLNWFPEAEHGGFYTAAIGGHYAAQGLAVEVRPGGRAIRVAGELASGRVQFAVANAEDVVIFRSQGADVVTVMTACQHHPRCILTRADSGVTSFADLGRKGMTLQVQQGHAFVEFMRSKGVLTGVKEVPFTGGVALTVGDSSFAQQGYVYSEPLLARQKGVAITTLMVSDLGFDPYSSVLVTTGKLVRERPDLVRRMVTAAIAGWRGYLADPTATNARLLEVNPEGVTRPMLEEGVAILRGLCLPGDMPVDELGTMTAERWDRLLEQMTALDPSLGAKVKATDCYTLAFLPEAAPGR
ncbi:MAG: ABC transporter substrate-binding protein [Planctomycetes bacterium]|nr:ABC transporter substrate-binding protein [Planctomycetota bacterium]MBM4059165.1 ABC transporter substrate-binding protein [Planctomycetota bacterium]